MAHIRCGESTATLSSNLPVWRLKKAVDAYSLPSLPAWECPGWVKPADVAAAYA